MSRLFLNLYTKVSLLFDWFERCIVVSLLLESSCCVEIGSSNSSRSLKVLCGTTQSASNLHMRNNVSHTQIYIYSKKQNIHPTVFPVSSFQWEFLSKGSQLRLESHNCQSAQDFHHSRNPRMSRPCKKRS